jgi:O-antigen/teichoic acid export membrane protein
MRRTFLSNLSLILILNLLIKPVYLLGIEAEVQNRVGPEVFGSYSALISLSFLLNILLDLGITNYNTRNIARNQQLVHNHFSGVVLLRLILGLFYMVVLTSAGWMLGYSSSFLLLLAMLGFNQFLAASILYLRSNLTGLMLFKRDAVLSILDRGLLVIGLGYVLLTMNQSSDFKIEWLVFGQTIAYGATLVVGFIFLMRHTGKLKLSWNLAFYRTILKQSFPYALLVLLMMGSYKTDSVMLERMLPNGDYHAGIYAMGYRFFEASNMIGFLFAGLLLPIFSRLIKTQKSLDPVISSAFQLLFSGGVILVVTCLLFGEQVLGLIYREYVTEALLPFYLLMCAFFFVCMTYIFGTLLTANGNMRTLNIMASIGFVLNITLNYLLIDLYFATGSAIASLITQGLVSTIQIYLAMKYTKLRFSGKTLRGMLLFSIWISGLAYLCTIINWSWKLEIVCFILLSFVGAFVSGFVHKQQFKELLTRVSD